MRASLSSRFYRDTPLDAADDAGALAFISRCNVTSLSYREAESVTALAFGVLPTGSRNSLLAFFGFEDHAPHPLPPLRPRHIYKWFNVLFCVVQEFSAYGKCTYSDAMQWRRLLSVTGSLIVLSGTKSSHVRSATLLHAVIDLAVTHGGSFVRTPARSAVLNCV